MAFITRRENGNACATPKSQETGADVLGMPPGAPIGRGDDAQKEGPAREGPSLFLIRSGNA